MENQTPATPPATGMDKNTWFLLCHISGLLISFIGPLIIWQVKKAEIPEIERHAKEAMNFQITAFLAFFVCTVLSCFFIGIFILPVVLIAWLVITILASLKAGKGEPYKYPLTINFIK